MPADLTTTLSLRALRIALAATLLVAAVLEAAGHGLWLPFALGAVGPDTALALGAGAGLARGRLHPRAVVPYNALHAYPVPVALVAAAATGVLGAWWLVLGLAWATHIAMDRVFGYGLRDREGFQRAR